MSWKLSLIPALLLPWSAAHAMNCDQKNLTPTEKAICDNPGDLGRLDDKLQRLYDRRLERAKDAKGKNALRTSQKAWLKTRDACKADVACLKKHLEQRVIQLADCKAPSTTCKEEPSLRKEPLSKNALPVTFVDIGQDESSICIPVLRDPGKSAQMVNRDNLKIHAAEECPSDFSVALASAITINTPQLFAYTASVEATGGAHPSFSTVSYVWDMTSGKRIDLEREFEKLIQRIQSKPSETERTAFNMGPKKTDKPEECEPASSFQVLVREDGVEVQSVYPHVAAVCTDTVSFSWKNIANELPAGSPFRTLVR